MANINNSTEIWKDVKGFEGRYQISNLGNLLSIGGKTKEPKLIISNKTDSGGYYNVSLRSVKHGIKRKCIRIHQIVAEHFIEKPTTSERLEIDHKDSNKTNNRVDNLHWVTSTQHRNITMDKGEIDIKGEKHPQAKVNRFDVLKMRELYANGNLTHKQISKIFGLSRRHVCDIINRNCWEWL